VRHLADTLELEGALDLARETGDRYPEAEALIGLAAAHQYLDQLEPAGTCARKAHAISHEAGHRLGAARTLIVLGRALGHTGAADAAARHHKVARLLLAEIRPSGVDDPAADRVERD